MQDLRTCDEFFGFRTISRGLHPREIVQLRKPYYGYMNGGAQTGRLAAEVVAEQVLGIRPAAAQAQWDREVG
ncbi:MAG: hypothetical protein SNJ50_15550 [Cyanobacteriota bacterium]